MLLKHVYLQDFTTDALKKKTPTVAIFLGCFSGPQSSLEPTRFEAKPRNPDGGGGSKGISLAGPGQLMNRRRTAGPGATRVVAFALEAALRARLERQGGAVKSRLPSSAAHSTPGSRLARAQSPALFQDLPWTRRRKHRRGPYGLEVDQRSCAAAAKI